MVWNVRTILSHSTRLDLEDTSAIINAKLGMLEVVWAMEEGLERASYQAVLHEMS